MNDMNEKKQNSRSVRMTNTVMNFVMEQPGTGFNKKLENMILFCMAEKPKIEKQIKVKNTEFKTILGKIESHKSILADIDNFKYNMERVFMRAGRMTENNTKETIICSSCEAERERMLDNERK